VTFDLDFAAGDRCIQPREAVPGEIEIKDEDYEGRGFSCRDLEGHLWNVGT